MLRLFKTIGLMGRQRSIESATTLIELKNHLLQQKYQLIFEEETAKFTNETVLPSYPREQFGKYCDLVIVVGGDGSILNAARAVVDHQIPVLGINRGRLGFLTDIHPSELVYRVDEVLSGHYITERRFLLTAEIIYEGQVLYEEIALNDVVLMPGEYAHMIEFEIYIDDQFVCSQRSDGQIIATPTGSTAYALSGGGPILHPALDAVVLVPMFSHTLSSRPIVINANSSISIMIPKECETSPRISCDGQQRMPIAPGGRLNIHKKKEQLILLHPTDYNYFETLRSKLHWQTKL